jgi:hypothetical protein
LVTDDNHSWLDAEAWQAFVDMRKAKGKRAPFTAAARSLVLAKLKRMDELGHDPNEALRESVINGWSGVFVPKLSTVEKKTPNFVAPWDHTRASIEAKGVEVGVGRWDQYAFEHGVGETFANYTGRIRRLLDKGEAHD